MPLFLNAILNW